MWKDIVTRTWIPAALLLALPGISHPADKDKIVWKSIPDGILQIDGRAPKIWNLYRSGKKLDPLLLQIGSRSLVIYIKNQEVYEIKPEQLERKGEDLLWREADRATKPLATTEWSTRDVGSAWRVRVKLADEGRMIDIQIPQMPDLRGLY
jgi:hypothetical protein